MQLFDSVRNALALMWARVAGAAASLTMFDAVIRGAPRLLALLGVAALFFVGGFAPELFGQRDGLWPVLVPAFNALGLVFLGWAAADFGLRLWQPKVDPQACAQTANEKLEVAPAIVYAARMFITGLVIVLTVTAAHGAQPPAAAVPLLPVLKSEQLAWWPSMPLPSALGAQVEQETGCPGRSCWNPQAQLRTSREQGFGLSQLTRTWNKDGSQRFDALTDLVKAHPRELAGFSWEHRLDPRLQLRALVIKDLDDYRVVLNTATSLDRLAMTLASYNGGRGGLMSDRRMCAATPGCDPMRWFGNVERTSRKAKTAAKGYGKSFFETNREYPRNILLVRRVRYLSLDA